jgi:hypothetical protein
MHYKVMLSDPSTRWEIMASVFFSTLPNLEEFCLGRQVDFKGQVFRRARPIPALSGGHLPPEHDIHNFNEANNNAAHPAKPNLNENNNTVHPPNPNEPPNSPDGANPTPNPTHHTETKPLLIRKYLDPLAPNYHLSFPYNPSPRLVFPPARWSGTRCVWWPINGAVPSDPANFGQPDEPQGTVQFTTPAPELGIGRGGHAGGGQRYVHAFRLLFSLSGLVFAVARVLWWDIMRRKEKEGKGVWVRVGEVVVLAVLLAGGVFFFSLGLAVYVHWYARYASFEGW